MKTEIYYFTGTGNSLAAARGIAERTKAKLIAIPSVMDGEKINPGADAFGVVFPVYHGGLPYILVRFFRKIARLEKKYIFGVCTYGDHPGLCMDYLKSLIQSQGGQLAAGFAIHMPYNYITPSLTLKSFTGSFTLREITAQKQDELFAGAQKKIENISAFVGTHQTGTYETDSEWITSLVDYFHIKETLGKTVWLKIGGVHEPVELPFMESRQLMDHAFLADEHCNGCGYCSRVCPVGNISMVDGRPEWQHHCEQCFACLQWCPQQALQFGQNTAGRKRYHHPDSKLSDLLMPAPGTF